MIEFEKLKRDVENEIVDIMKYEERAEDLRDLHITVTNMRDLFHILTENQAVELKGMIEKVAKENNISLLKRI